MTTEAQRPIAVFDSGVGGLTVLKSLRQRFPHQNFVYLGDTARLPYGNKNPKTIRAYLEQCLNFLTQFNPAAYVVACNSASTQAFESTWKGQPLINVIDPMVHTAVKVSSLKRIGVLGTRATIQSQIFSDKITQLESQAQVFAQDCPLFVPLAEEGWVDDPITNLIVYRYLSLLNNKNIDTLILGCTHYPLLASAIQKAVGNQVQLLEAGPIIGQTLADLFAQGSVPISNQGQLEIYLTDYSTHLNRWAKQILDLSPDFDFQWVHLN